MKAKAQHFSEDLEALLRQYRMTGSVHYIKKKTYGQFRHREGGMTFEFKLKYISIYRLKIISTINKNTWRNITWIRFLKC